MREEGIKLEKKKKKKKDKEYIPVCIFPFLLNWNVRDGEAARVGGQAGVGLKESDRG